MTSPKQRYPEPRQTYANRVGSLGEISIGHVLDNYKFDWHHVNAQGADFTMPSYDIGIEVWNHSKAHGYMKRGQSVCDNLSNFKYKFLVASFISNGMRQMMDQHNVVVVELGFQITLNEYVPFYQHYRKLEGKKTLNRRTLKIMRNMLNPVFEAIKEQEDKMTISVNSKLTKEDPHLSSGAMIQTHVCTTSNVNNGPTLYSCSTRKISSTTVNNQVLHNKTPNSKEKNIIMPRHLGPNSNIIKKTTISSKETNLLRDNCMTLILLALIFPIYKQKDHLSTTLKRKLKLVVHLLCLNALLPTYILRRSKIKHVHTRFTLNNNTHNASSTNPPLSYTIREYFEFYWPIVHRLMLMINKTLYLSCFKPIISLLIDGPKSSFQVISRFT